MSKIFGLAGLNASDYQFARTADQRLVYDAVQQLVQRVNNDMNDAMRVFVQETTQVFKERYQLPGSGYMQRRADGARGPAVKAYGSWDVAYPLYDYGEQVSGTDIQFAYMTPAELDRHVQTVINGYANAVRRDILVALTAGTNVTFNDERNGTLTCVPLANGDSVTYPPVLGAVSEATENHYIESNYAASSISDTNDPVATIINELEEHFGTATGNNNIAVFINNAQNAQIAGLAAFVDTPDRYVREGSNTALPDGLPNIPGKIIGRHRNGAWISEWRWIPANYVVGIHLDVPAPLKMRVDPAETGLPRGLALMSRDMNYPLESSEWRARFGFGVANRLNGVVVELGTGGSYTAPTIA